ncbi:ABC transporter substrate-binding protein [Clostridium sp. AN503]|uniref:ABC transporter substrate-binding protein n=1 Tax=Clostridium sp. AN503 TaxID=3160598 RepID=UPI0034586B7A
MRRAKKVVALGLASILAMGVLTGCSGNKEAAGTGKADGKTEAELEKVTVSIHPSGHGLPAYIAEEMGYYEEEGLDVETLVYIGAPPQMEAYEAGAWDIGTTGFGGIVLGVAKSSLQVIGVTIDDGTVMGLWAREDSDIAKAGYHDETGCYGTAEEWKDLEILYTQGTITDIMLTSTLTQLGLVPDDVVRTNMDSSPAFTAFQAGSGDLVQANSSFYFNAEEEGWVPVTTGTSQNIYMPSVIVASDKMIAERPETAEKWVRAYMKGVQWIKDNPEEAAGKFVEFCEENGVATDEANALKFVKAQIVGIPGVEEQLTYFAPAEDSEDSVLQQALARCMDVYVEMGNYTQEDADALMLDENYNASFMEKLK